MLDEFIKGVKIYLYERIVSPLSGAFIVSWCIWNYRFWAVLLSSLPVTEKFVAIDKIYPDKASYLYPGLIFPLITALAYIFIYPYPAKLIYAFWRRRQKDLNELRQKIENDTCLTIEQSRKIYSDMFRQQEEYKQELTMRDSEIQRLQQELDGLKGRDSSHYLDVNRKGKTDHDLSPKEVELLYEISKRDPMYYHESELMGLGEPSITKYYIDELVHKNYLKPDHAGGSTKYQLTHEARAYLIDKPKKETKR